jgi:hypothetical protein
MSIFRSIGTPIIAWALVLMSVSAHETWAEPVILIHYSEPGGPLDAYKPDQVTDVSAIGADGHAVPVALRAVGGAAVAVTAEGGEPAALFYAMRLGHYVINGDDWLPATAEEAAAAQKSWTGQFSATSILTWHPALSQPRQRPIELIPDVDPSSIPVGQLLPLRAYRHGRPAAGVQIYAGEGKPPLSSDADGRLSIPVRAGHQVITASIDEVVGGRTMGWIATLSFRHP